MRSEKPEVLNWPVCPTWSLTQAQKDDVLVTYTSCLFEACWGCGSRGKDHKVKCIVLCNIFSLISRHFKVLPWRSGNCSRNEVLEEWSAFGFSRFHLYLWIICQKQANCFLKKNKASEVSEICLFLKKRMYTKDYCLKISLDCMKILIESC